MNGAVLVLPREGLSDGAGKPLKYDRIYYVGEQDFYVPRDASGAYKTYASAADSFVDMMAVMRKLIPTHVVFNGAVGALTDKNAMPAKVGETVLIIHSSANARHPSALIGGHGDYVWLMGKFANPPMRDLETWVVPGGSAVGGALHVPPARRLRLRQSQPHRGGRARRHRALPRRRQVERRPDDPGAPAGPDRLSAPRAVAAENQKRRLNDALFPPRHRRNRHRRDGVARRSPPPRAARACARPARRAPASSTLQPGWFAYRPLGDFESAGKTIDAPARATRLDAPLDVMVEPVSQAEYARCVAAAACPKAEGASIRRRTTCRSSA